MQQEEIRLLLQTIGDTRGSEAVRKSIQGIKTETSTERATSALQQLTRGFNVSGESALRFVGALTGVEIGLSVIASVGRNLRESITTSTEAFIEAQRVNRATAASYGANAEAFQRFASTLSTQTGFTKQAILEAALSARTLSDNYALTTVQTQKLIEVSANLAQLRGIGIAESFERIQSAIRGEAEASEYLGLTLNDTFIANNAMNGSLKQTFGTMTDQQKAQIRYGEILRQTSQFAGLASQGTQGLEGSTRNAALASQLLSIELGKTLAPAMQTINELSATGTEILTGWIISLRGATETIAALRGLTGGPQGGIKLLPDITGEDPRFRQTDLQKQLADKQRQGVLSGQQLDRTAPPVGPPRETPAVNKFSQDIDKLSKIQLPQVTQGTAGFQKAIDDLARSIFQAPPAPPLPHIVDVSAREADLSVKRLTADLDVLSNTSGQLSTLLGAIGDSGQSGIEGALRAAQDLQKVEEALTARLAANQTRDQLRRQSQISDPRDAPGARVAQERLRILDQLEPAEQRLLQLQEAQGEVQKAIAADQLASAQITLQQLPIRERIADLEQRISDASDRRVSLERELQRIQAEQAAAPATQAAEDTQAQIERDKLVIADRRNQSKEDVSAARKEIRDLQRNVLPGQQVAAHDAQRDLQLLDRAGRTADQATRTRQIPLEIQKADAERGLRPTDQQLREINANRQRSEVLSQVGQGAITQQKETISDIIKAAVAAGVQSSPTQINLRIEVADTQGTIQTIEQLIEAVPQAATPPAVQLSAVRR